MQEILIATGNPGKYKEIMEVLGSLDFDFVFLKDLNIDSSDFEEDGVDFKENAYKKAAYFREKTGMITLAEDTGLLVDALPGELGVKTRRWGAGEHASDAEWIEYFMQRMDSEANRKARFVCNACIIGDDFHEHFEGETEGVITAELMCEIEEGLPLGACFLAEGREKVYSAMSKEEKNAISHRGVAINAMKSFLEGR